MAKAWRSREAPGTGQGCLRLGVPPPGLEVGVRLAEDGRGTTTARWFPALQEGPPAHDEKGLIMRLGTWRGVTFAVALAATITAGGPARANDPFHPSIPREVDA